MGGVGERRHVGEEGLQLLVPVLERPGGLDRVAQDLRERRRHVGVGVAHRRRQAEVAHDLRDLRVDPLQVVVDGDEVLPELVTATLESGRDRVEREVEVGGLHGAEQRVEVGEDLLHLDRHLGAGDRGTGLQRLRRRVLGNDEGDVLLAEQRLGDDRARSRSAGSCASGRGRSPASRSHPASVALKPMTWPTITPRIFTSARSGICSPMVDASRVTSSKWVNFCVNTP